MRVLFTPYGGGSIAHIVRSLAVADELRERGHEILFTSPTTKKSFIEKAGYEVFGSGHPEVNLNDEQDQSITYFRRNRGAFLEWLGDEIAAAETYRPDIIVNSPTFFGPLASLKLGTPHISIINAQWLTEFRGLLGLSKSKNSLSHRALRRAAAPIFVRQFERIYMDEIRSFYEQLNVGYLPAKRRDLHRHFPALIPGIPEFEPVRNSSRSDIHYVGPLFWQGFEKGEFDPPSIFHDFTRKPFVYVTLGGSIYRKKSYEELIAALSQKMEWNILLSIGPNFKRSEFPPDSSHFKIEPYVPGLQACEYADVVINTAGHGTVMQALWHGKPLVTLPHNIDQGTIASRLEELNLGINLNKIGIRDFSHREKYYNRATNVPWQTIIRKTEATLSDTRMLASARSFREKLRAFGDAEKKAADYIEHYAGKKG